MNPERWQRVDQIFQAVIELDPSERSALLNTSCAGDEELRKEVESLISFDELGLSFIDEPALQIGASLLTTSTPELAVGQKIGHYEIAGLIGRGGMGDVYLAQDSRLNRRVALKFLPVDYTKHKDRMQRFQREAQAVSALNHPNILTIHELGEVDGQQFIATEFVDGETLRDRLKSGPFSLSECLEIAIQTASALSAAHQAGIVHRDIKPENIMLRPDGYVKVLDFGLAKLAEQHEAPPGTRSTEDVDLSSGLMMGTVKYMSPEQAQGLSVDTRSDIFSFGVVLHEMLTGHPPFQGDSAGKLIESILKNRPPRLTEYLPDTPANLQTVVDTALAKDKSRRYQITEDMLVALKALKVLEESGTAPVTIVGRIKQYRVAASFVSVVLLVALAGASFGLYKYFVSRSVHVPFQNVNVTRVTNFGDAWAPSLSPDGKYVVYAKNQQPSTTGKPAFSLWLRAVGTASEVPLVPEQRGRCYSTAFAPDGKHIYYGVGPGELLKIFMIPIDGGDSTELPLKRGSPFSISPDSRSLAFLDSNTADGETSLVIANADGTNERKIITRPDANYSLRGVRPSWSPDGKKIACAGLDKGTSFPHVFVVDIDARTETKVPTIKWTDIRGVSWLPDASGLILVAAEETSSIPQIWHIAYPGGEESRITNDAVNYSRLDLTAAGGTVATTAGEIQTAIWVMPVENGQSDSTGPLSVDTSKAMQIASVSLTSRDDLNNVYERLSWTPEGRIVYMSKESGNADIWSMDAVGGDRKQLTTDRHSDNDSIVSPDGRYVAFVSNRAGAENIWIMDADGGNQRRLTSRFIERSPDFSADSNWVYFNSWETGIATIWKVSVDGGVPLQVLSNPSQYPSISPEGNLMAYIGDRTTNTAQEDIFITASDGGSPIAFYKGNNHLNWTPNGKAVTYSLQGSVEGQASRQVFNLWEQRLDSSTPRQLTGFPDPIFVHAWSRDGRKLVVLTAKYSSDIVLINDVR